MKPYLHPKKSLSFFVSYLVIFLKKFGKELKKGKPISTMKFLEQCV